VVAGNYVQAIVALVLLGIACGMISTAVTMSKIFKGFRLWIQKRSKFLHELFSCPYCFSHWVAGAITLYAPAELIIVPIYASVAKAAFVSLVVQWLVMTCISSITAGVIKKLLS